MIIDQGKQAVGRNLVKLTRGYFRLKMHLLVFFREHKKRIEVEAKCLQRMNKIHQYGPAQ